MNPYVFSAYFWSVHPDCLIPIMVITISTMFYIPHMCGAFRHAYSRVAGNGD